jgi:hypothetical protein
MGSTCLEYYASPGRFTRCDAVGPSDIAALVAIVQGVLVYDTVAEPLYGVRLTPARAATIHERDVAALLDAVLAVDPRPITEARPPDARVGARCRTFSTLTVALLRAAGIPARARCGFGAYFRPGWFEDHWVAEYWDSNAQQWRMVDAQLDEKWMHLTGFDGDPLAVTTDQFVTAGHAWQRWRRGDMDAGRCGLSVIPEHGAHWIAGNLRLDLAALNKVEMLPWDLWGVGWEPGEEPTDDLLALLDAVAAMTVAPDDNFDELRELYDSDDSLRMDGTVFNVERGALETISQPHEARPEEWPG